MPTGTVTLQIDGGTNFGGTTVANQALSNGAATYSATFTTTGPHQVLAQYSGDATHAPSVGVGAVTIGTTSSGKGTFALAATPSTLTVTRGSSGNENITITPSGGYTGTVLLNFSTSNDSALANLCYSFTTTSSSGAGSVGGHGHGGGHHPAHIRYQRIRLRLRYRRRQARHAPAAQPAGRQSQPQLHPKPAPESPSGGSCLCRPAARRIPGPLRAQVPFRCLGPGSGGRRPGHVRLQQQHHQRTSPIRPGAATPSRSPARIPSPQPTPPPPRSRSPSSNCLLGAPGLASETWDARSRSTESPIPSALL